MANTLNTATFRELVEDPRYGFALKLRESDGKMVYMDDSGRYFYENKFTNTPLHFTDIQRLKPITYSLPDLTQLVDIDKERFGYIKPTVKDIKIPKVEYDAGELGEIVAIAKAPENYQQILDELQKKKEAYEEQLYLDWLNSPKGEFKLNLNIQTTWGNRGFDYLNGAAYSQGYLDHLHDPELLRRWNNFSLGLLAPNILFAAPAVAGLSGTTAGNVIGNVAGSMAIGKALEEGLRLFFGASAGDNIVNTLNRWGVNPYISELGRIEYWLNPTGKYTSHLLKGLGLTLYDPMKAFTHVGVGNSIERTALHGQSHTPVGEIKHYYNNKIAPSGTVPVKALLPAAKIPLHLEGAPLTILLPRVSTVTAENVVKAGKAAAKKAKWTPEHIPGYLLKPLMTGSSLERAVSKDGTIDVSVLRSLLRNTSNVSREIIESVLRALFPGQKKVDYNLLRKATQNWLVTFDMQPATKLQAYGIDGLGYQLNGSVWTGNSPDVNLSTTLYSSSKIPRGSSLHYLDNTLGHVRTFTTDDDPSILYVMESQSDWAQQNSVNKGKIKNLQDRIKVLEGIKKDPQYINEFLTEDVIDDWIRVLETDLYVARMRLTIPTAHEKYIMDNNVRRLMLENMLLAAKQGQTKMRYPTSETAAKILYYPKEHVTYPDQEDIVSRNEFIYRLLKESEVNKPTSTQYDPNYNEKLRRWNDYKDNMRSLIKPVTPTTVYDYSPQHKTILSKYTEFPKIYKSIIKDGEVRTVTDPKGNTWYEIDIPENFLDMELQYKKGGLIKLRFI